MLSEDGGFRLRVCGDRAVSVEFGDRVDESLHARVLALDAALGKEVIGGVVETVPTYRSLLVVVDPVRVEFEALVDRLRSLAKDAVPAGRAPCRWRVPVVYGGAFGEDLEPLATERGMTPDAFAALHASVVYRVFMIGFMPGFAYLGGLDPRLAAPRRQEPRPRVPTGSIAIGGEQTSIGSVEAPSGWHLIGRTPVRCFQPGRDPLFLFEAGQEVVFEPVPASAWDELCEEAEAGGLVASLAAP